MDMTILKDIDVLAAIHQMLENQKGEETPSDLTDPSVRKALAQSLMSKLAVTRKLLTMKKPESK